MELDFAYWPAGYLLAAQKIKIAKPELSEWGVEDYAINEFMQLIKHHLCRMHSYLWLRIERCLTPRKCTKITRRQIDNDLTFNSFHMHPLSGLHKWYGSLFPSKLLEECLNLCEISTKGLMMAKRLVSGWHLLTDLVWDLCFQTEHINPWTD